KSEVVFLCTCWGVVLRDSIYDVETSLGRAFADSAATAALVTTFSTTFLNRTAGLWAAERYSSGDTLGEVVNGVNERHGSSYAGSEDTVVLFGDPCHSAPPGSRLSLFEADPSPAFGLFLRNANLEDRRGQNSGLGVLQETDQVT